MSRKDTILRILIVVGVLYTALLMIMIVLLAMTMSALSGLRVSYDSLVGNNSSQSNSELKSYSNSLYSFNYSSEWTAVANKSKPDNTLFGVAATSESGTGGVEVSLNEVSIDSFLAKVYSADQLTNTTNITVDGVVGVKQNYNSNVDGLHVVLFKDTTIYSIYINSSDSTQLKLFDNLVASFKFLDGTKITTKTFSEPHFTNLKINYNSDWTLATTEDTVKSRVDANGGSTETDVTYVKAISLTKGTSKLNVTMDISTAFGWGNSCYKVGEINYEKLSNGWFRTKHDNKYFYTKSLTLTADMTADEVSNTKQAFSYTDAQWAEFVICGSAGGAESAMAIGTIINTPDTGVYGAILNIWFEGSDSLLSEVDGFIISSATAGGGLGN